jgi:hypothetical protein
MQRTACVLAFCILALGCQKNSQPTTTAAKTEHGEQNEVSQAGGTSGHASEVRKADFVTADSKATVDSPELLVRKFVSALRKGDAREARNLLTEKARYETRRHGLEVDPQMFPNTSFEVKETTYTSNHRNVAYVGCKWSESDAASKEFELKWVAKHDEEGWRISGFFTSVDGAEDLKLLNFENVPEMLAVMENSEGETKAAKSEKTGN